MVQVNVTGAFDPSCSAMSNLFIHKKQEWGRTSKNGTVKWPSQHHSSVREVEPESKWPTSREPALSKKCILASRLGSTTLLMLPKDEPGSQLTTNRWPDFFSPQGSSQIKRTWSCGRVGRGDSALLLDRAPSEQNCDK